MSEEKEVTGCRARDEVQVMEDFAEYNKELTADPSSPLTCIGEDGVDKDASGEGRENDRSISNRVLLRILIFS